MENRYCEYPIPITEVKAEAIEPRICRDKMFMEIARIVAKRGTCDRARVGAVLVDPCNNIVSIGYNGAPSGEPHCDQAGHIMYQGHCIRTVHAEENCLNKVVPVIEGTYTMYVTHYPCSKCQVTMFEKISKQTGVKLKVVYDSYYGRETHISQLQEVQKYVEFAKYSS